MEVTFVLVAILCVIVIATSIFLAKFAIIKAKKRS
jgi:hypothetical protein